MRVEHLRPESLTPAQQSLYDTIVGGPRSGSGPRVVDAEGRLEGPFNAMLTQPALGLAVQDVGRVLRFEGVLTDRCREIVILTVADAARSAYEWDAHCRLATSAGLTDADLVALRDGESARFGPDEQAAFDLARTLVHDREVSDEEFARAEATIGAGGIFEVTVLVGYYRMLAQQLSIFRVPAPTGPWET